MTVKTSKAPHLLALALTMTGCEFIGPQPHTKLSLPQAQPVDETFVSTGDENLAPRNTQVELFPSEESSIVSGKTAKSDRKASGKGEYSLNFDDADLGEVAKVILSDILKENYTISPQVSGKVTLQTTQPLTKSDLIPTLEMLVGINNAALSHENGMYMIKPANEAVYNTSIKTIGSSALPSGYQTRVIPIHNVAVAEIAEILKPLLP